ncbi:MAG: DUF5050 domain-containing protein [Dehalobacterium sp.]|jgi:hypothetical protein
MKLFKALVLLLTILIAGNATAWAEDTGEIVKKPLDQVFEQTIIVPFDYHDKVFLNGVKTDIYGDYKLFQLKGRVLVPIRMMGNLADEMENNGYWQVDWNAKNPDDVILVNYQLKKTVKLKVNNKTMYINNEPISLDVAPQNIQGRVVLPLRGISEALGIKIAWLDGLIIMSNDHIDLQHPQTTGIKSAIREKLTDAREEINYEERVTPITEYDNSLYYLRTKYTNSGTDDTLFRKTGNQETKIDLPGQESFVHSRVINNELYYISTTKGKSALHIFSFADQKSRKLCDLGDWNPNDGWLGATKYMNDALYLELHVGDGIMGGDTLYQVENGALKEIATAKSFMSFDIAGDYLYYADFHPMWGSTANNLHRINLTTGEKETLGKTGFAYGIFRVIGTDGSTSLSGHNTFYLKDNSLFTLGYQESDDNDQCAVYKINLDDNTQEKLTMPAAAFWLVNDHIYYQDAATGYLVCVDLDGANSKTIVDKRIIETQFYEGNIYYTASTKEGQGPSLGQLYQYNIANNQEIKLSDHLVSAFFVGPSEVYYQAEGYEMGLHKIDAMGKNTLLEDDSIYSALFTEDGIVYTLKYEDGIYFVQ